MHRFALSIRGSAHMERFNTPSQWRHNETDAVSNHQPHDCLLNRLFRRRSKKTSKLRVTDLFARNSQMASNAENFSIWWRHHALCHFVLSDEIPMRGPIVGCLVDSLWSSVAIWWYRSLATLSQIMACCLTHQAINWSNVDLSSMGFTGIHVRAICQGITHDIDV